MRTLIKGTAIAIAVMFAAPTIAAPLTPPTKASDASLVQVKAKKKSARHSAKKRQIGNDTTNSPSGTATQDGGRGGGMSGSPDPTGSGTR